MIMIVLNLPCGIFLQIAVLGACKCRVTSPEPCGCAHAAAHLRQEISKLKSQVNDII